MQREQRPGRRKRWEIMYQVLTAPQKAEDSATTVGVPVSTVHRVIATDKWEGGAAIETPGNGGRRHQYLTLEQEHAFLQPFVARVAQGERVVGAEIHHTFEEHVGHGVDDSTISRLLNRQGWRHHGTGVKASSSSAPALESTRVQGDEVTVQARRTQSFSPKPTRKQPS